MATYSLALAALADPTRRRLLGRLRKRERAVGALAKSLAISQPAVSQHLSVLRRARLVRERRDGTRHLFRAAPAGLMHLRSFLDSFWDDVLSAFAGASPRRKSRIKTKERGRMSSRP